jgi:glycosyltransferase involved in cell wall biosynthesis
MLLCRPFFPRLVLHWHAAGLAEWLVSHGAAWERWLTYELLGRASLSIVLSPQLQADAASLAPQKIAAVANGIADPGSSEPATITAAPCRLLFLGLCSDEKGVFAAAEAVLAANHELTAPAFTLAAAGPFPDDATAERFRKLCAEHPGSLRHVGPVDGAGKNKLFQASHGFCFPTHYEPEGQPLALLEAMAHDLPVIATRWRAIPGLLPPEAILVEPGDAGALVRALQQLRDHRPPPEVFRRHYLAHFTRERHLTALAAALSALRDRT